MNITLSADIRVVIMADAQYYIFIKFSMLHYDTID